MLLYLFLFLSLWCYSFSPVSYRILWLTAFLLGVGVAALVNFNFWVSGVCAIMLIVGAHVVASLCVFLASGEHSD